MCTAVKKRIYAILIQNLELESNAVDVKQERTERQKNEENNEIVKLRRCSIVTHPCVFYTYTKKEPRLLTKFY